MPRWDRIFVDIDTQFDFLDPSGRLYVPGAERIVPNLRRLVAAAAGGIPILSSADAHAPDDPEFAQFPPHCIRGTAGQRKLDATLLLNRVVLDPEPRMPNPAELLGRYDQIIFHKTTLDVFGNPNFARIIEEVEVGCYIVFGVATDYCVRAAAMGLLQRGRAVTLVADAIAAVSVEGAQRTCEELRRAGARFGTTDEILREVRPVACAG